METVGMLAHLVGMMGFDCAEQEQGESRKQKHSELLAYLCFLKPSYGFLRASCEAAVVLPLFDMLGCTQLAETL